MPRPRSSSGTRPTSSSARRSCSSSRVRTRVKTGRGTRSRGNVREPYGRRKDGTELPVEVTLSPIETDEGPLVSRAIRNITERKRIESELQLSNRELEAFSYSVAHDLRAPLRGINGFSLALLEDCADKLDPAGKDYLRRISDGATRMGQLIDALLGLARVTRKELRRESVNLTQLAEAVTKQLQAAEPGRTVVFDNQPNVLAQGDPQLLRAALENLLGNAWKFTGTREAGRVTFGSTVQKGATVYYVSDNGAGFDMAYAAKLFTPFQRLHSASEFAGTGIGLATVQRIVTRHGGRIWAEGHVGQGASFFFTLSDNAQGAARMNFADKPILLVEDNKDDELLMIRAFKKNGIVNEVIVARDGVEALDYLFGEGSHAGRDLSTQPQVVLLDLNLPRIGGLDVLRRIRSDERTKFQAVVVLTSSKEEEDILRSYSLGANSYVRKPVDFLEFGNAVKALGLFWLLLHEPAPVGRHGR